MFKRNSKDIRTIVDIFIVNFFNGVSIVDFQQVNILWLRSKL